MFLRISTYYFRKEQNPGSLTDEQLLKLHSERKDKEIISIFFDRYIHLVFASCMKYLRDEEQAQDAAMEIFECLHEKLLKHEVEFFKSWLYMLTRNHCLMILRKQKQVGFIHKIEDFRNIFVENDEELHHNEGKILEEALNMFLEMLKPEQKLCVELMYIRGMSYKEIAVETGYALNNVKSFIQNGKRNLKLMFDNYEDE